MISDKDKNIIIEFAKKYNVSYVILFGSSINENPNSTDIDIGLKGIDSRLFFKLYADLYKNLSKPVDLIDLSVNTKFNKLIEETGLVIYE